MTGDEYQLGEFRAGVFDHLAYYYGLTDAFQACRYATWDELQGLLDRLNLALDERRPIPEIVERPAFDIVQWLEGAGMFDRRPSLWE